MKMHLIVSKLFFTDRIIVKNSLGSPFETEGLFLNWFGRHLLFVVLAGWAGLMLALVV